jgi:hypothetical protein
MYVQPTVTSAWASAVSRVQSPFQITRSFTLCVCMLLRSVLYKTTVCFPHTFFFSEQITRTSSLRLPHKKCKFCTRTLCATPDIIDNTAKANVKTHLYSARKCNIVYKWNKCRTVVVSVRRDFYSNLTEGQTLRNGILEIFCNSFRQLFTS